MATRCCFNSSTSAKVLGSLVAYMSELFHCSACLFIQRTPLPGIVGMIGEISGPIKLWMTDMCADAILQKLQDISPEEQHTNYPRVMEFLGDGPYLDGSYQNVSLHASLRSSA